MKSWKEDNNKILAEINMTPLIDIMLVLLIIFMITSSVQLDSGLKIELPDFSGIPDQISSPIIISMEGRGRVFLQGQPISLPGLENELKVLLLKSQEKEVILQGDRRSFLEDIVKLMEIATRAGATSFSIATKKN